MDTGDASAIIMIGALLTRQHANLKNIRKWQIQGLVNHSILNLSHPDGLLIVRMLAQHATDGV